MPNTLLTAGTIAREALATLYETLTMARLVHRDFEADFAGKQGDTITVRKPATFTANRFNRGTGIVLQDATETSTSVQMANILDVSFAVTQEELTMRVQDFNRQFLAPAMQAIAQQIDRDLIALGVCSGVTQAVGTDGTTPTNPTILIDAAKLLNDAKVPASDRFSMLNTTIAAEFSKNTLFLAADQRGDTEGIREASLGRKFGFDNYVSSNFPGGAIAAGILPDSLTVAAAGANDSFVCHRNAIALVSRTLATPMGLPSSQVSTVSMDGIGLRVTMSYDQTKKQDVVSVDCLYGTKLLDPAKIVRIRG